MHFKKQQTLLKYIYKNLLKEPSKSSHINFFNMENTKIPLDEEKINMIQDIIMSCLVEEEHENILNKFNTTNKLLNKIQEIMKMALKENHDIKFSPITKSFFDTISEKDYKQVAQVLNNSISYAITSQIRSHLTKTDHWSFSLISYAELAVNLGTSFLFWWQQHVFGEFKPEKLFSEKAYNIYCKNKNINVKSQILEKWLLNYVKWIKSKQSLSESDIKQKQKIIVKLGSHFIEYFIKEEIFEESLENRTRFLSLKNIYEENLSISTTLYKPLLSPNSKYNSKSMTINNYKFNFMQRTNTSFDPKYKYIKSEALQNSINLNDTKYCIIGPFLDIYLQYDIEINNSMSFSRLLDDLSSSTARNIVDYIKLTFQLDMEKIIPSCKNLDEKKLLQQLLSFMQDEQIFDRNLQLKFSAHMGKCKKQLENSLGNKSKSNTKLTGKNDALNLSIYSGKFMKDYLKFMNQKDKHKMLYKRKSTARLLWDTFDKVASQKFFKYFFLEDAYFYRHFEFFYLPKDITGITRVQYLPYFLNYQTHRFARGFLAYYSKTKFITENSYNKTKQVFCDVLETTKHKFSKLSFSEYEKETSKAKNDFLLHFFNDTIKIEDLLNITFSSLLDVITKYLTYTKKLNEGLYAFSILYYMLNEKEKNFSNIEPIIVLDSTNSVTQHIASIFKNKTAAHFGCLEGNDYNDVNAICLNKFNDFIKCKLPLEATKCLEILKMDRLDLKIIKEVYDSFYDLLKLSKKERIYKDLTCFFECISKNCDSFINTITFSEINDDFLAQFAAIVENSTCDIEINTNTNFCLKNQFKLRILIIITDYTINTILKQESWLNKVLLSRDIIKPRIMPEAYGMTLNGGYDAIFKAILKKNLNDGNFNSDYAGAQVFAYMLSSYFSFYFKTKYMPFLQEILYIRKFLKYRQSNNLTLSTEYVTWIYTPMIIKTIRLNMASLKHTASLVNGIQKSSFKGLRRFVNIAYNSGILDKRKMSNALCVHIIHTQETYIMLNWIMQAQKLNKLLKTNTELEYGYTSSFDCFGTNFKYIVFLRYHIENSYNYFYKNNQVLSSLLKYFEGNTTQMKAARNYILGLVKKKDDPNYWDGTITNKFFVKH